MIRFHFEIVKVHVKDLGVSRVDGLAGLFLKTWERFVKGMHIEPDHFFRCLTAHVLVLAQVNRKREVLSQVQSNKF